MATISHKECYECYKIHVILNISVLRYGEDCLKRPENSLTFIISCIEKLILRQIFKLITYNDYCSILWLTVLYR